MKYTLLFVITFLIISCGNEPRVNPNNIIGQRLVDVPYGTGGGSFLTTINGDVRTAYARKYNRNIAIIFVTFNGVVLDFYFSPFINFNKVRNLPVGLSYQEVVERVGKPASFLYNIWTPDSHYFQVIYLQRSRRRGINPISNLFVTMSFDNNGSLIRVGRPKSGLP
ncbi:MAG: hypothetical protein FWC34_00400 [Bacteroidetes bacterium]|nr:hypothetical protein [Bacteroidota bacterium]